MTAPDAPALRALPVGRDALLLELDGPEEAQALHAELLRRRDAGTLPPVREIVPAARTVLLDGLDARAGSPPTSRAGRCRP